MANTSPSSSPSSSPYHTLAATTSNSTFVNSDRFHTQRDTLSFSFWVRDALPITILVAYAVSFLGLLVLFLRIQARRRAMAVSGDGKGGRWQWRSDRKGKGGYERVGENDLEAGYFGDVDLEKGWTKVLQPVLPSPMAEMKCDTLDTTRSALEFSFGSYNLPADDAGAAEVGFEPGPTAADRDILAAEDELRRTYGNCTLDYDDNLQYTSSSPSYPSSSSPSSSSQIKTADTATFTNHNLRLSMPENVYTRQHDNLNSFDIADTINDADTIDKIHTSLLYPLLQPQAQFQSTRSLTGTDVGPSKTSSTTSGSVSSGDSIPGSSSSGSRLGSNQHASPSPTPMKHVQKRTSGVATGSSIKVAESPSASPGRLSRLVGVMMDRSFEWLVPA